MTDNLCRARRDGRICIRPAGALAGKGPGKGLLHQQHRSADGKAWYYSDGEKEAIAHIPLIELIYAEVASTSR